MKASELKGRPIVSLSGGVKVGDFSDLTLDASSVLVSAIILTGQNGNSVVPFPAVRHIGPDAVTIDDSRIVQATARAGEIVERRFSTINGLSVLSEQGAIVGTIDDLEFDDESGKITALFVHHGGVMGIGGSHDRVAASEVRGIGPDLVTVDLTPAAASTTA